MNLPNPKRTRAFLSPDNRTTAILRGGKIALISLKAEQRGAIIQGRKKPRAVRSNLAFLVGEPENLTSLYGVVNVVNVYNVISVFSVVI